MSQERRPSTDADLCESCGKRPGRANLCPEHGHVHAHGCVHVGDGQLRWLCGECTAREARGETHPAMELLGADPDPDGRAALVVWAVEHGIDPMAVMWERLEQLREEGSG